VAVYVVSHHVVQYGMIKLAEFTAVAHAKGVPVIVDAASEYDLRGFLVAGADLALYSSHKFLDGPTGGVGRGMKVDMEGIAGTIAALQASERRDHAAIRAAETRVLAL
jgi:D-glucosaminate-6-phosphate ammonia-lyase